MLKQKNKKLETGITLIALVVSIIVLIILAGVSIAMLVGENGIITQAQTAAQETEQAKVLEEINLYISEYQANQYAGTETRNLSEYLKEKLGVDPVTENKYGTLMFKIEDKILTVYKDGTTEIKDYQKNTLANNAPLVASEVATELTENDGFLTDNGVARKYIKEINFNTNNEVPSSYDVSWDVSEIQDGSVMAYASGNETSGYNVTIVADGEIYMPENSTSLFQLCGYKEDLPEYEIYLTGINTSKVKNMHNTFCQFGYYSMTSLELGDDFDISNVSNMEGMFGYCGYNKMESLNLGNSFDTSNVENMTSMFWNCGYSAMVTLNLGNNFNTSNVSNMEGMFGSCGYNAMTNLNLGDKFDTSNVTNMERMFSNCGYNAMTNLNLGDKFDTSNVTNMGLMFENCGHNVMTSLSLGNNFSTSNVVNMRYMFQDCGYNAMTSLNLGDKFDTSNVINMEAMFARCGYSKLTSLDLGDKFVTTKVENMKNLFYGCENLEQLYLGNCFAEVKENADITNVLYNCGTSTCRYYVSTADAQTWLLNLNSNYRRTENWNAEYILVQ